MQNIANHYPVVQLKYGIHNYTINEVASSAQHAIWFVRHGSFSTSDVKILPLVIHIKDNPNPAFDITLGQNPNGANCDITATVGNDAIKFRNLKVTFTTSVGLFTNGSDTIDVNTGDNGETAVAALIGLWSKYYCCCEN